MGYYKDLLPAMTAANVPQPYAVQANEQVTNGLLWYAVDKNSSTFWNTNAKAPSCWFRVDFGNKVKVARYSISIDTTVPPTGFNLEASETGLFSGEQVILDSQNSVVWNTDGKNQYDTNNSNSYRYYRVNFTSGTYSMRIKEFEFLEYVHHNRILLSSGDKFYSVGGIKYENAIPKMTSNTSASPIVPIFSTEWTNGIQTGAGSAFNAFDGDKEKVFGWSSASSGYYIGIDWSIEKKIIGYRLTSHSSISNTPPTAWYFESSNDNSTWTILDTKTGISWTKGETKEFIIKNELSYRYYRIRGTLNITWAIAEFELLHLSPSYLVSVPKLNEESFLKYGRDSSVPFNLMNKVQKNKDEYNSLGSGKTFEHTVDMSKRRVDKITLG
ncbi:discoidin domain-containing protein [Paenibacillus sp. FSL K6-1122]|uniref:discoidin domain-containing protein n=1 Tax=Paenibacillus sp. FSL K6-1122 TaxID=2954512 RepID=UPI0030EBA1B5